MALVLGIDSSTQSCKVEVREATTGELIGCGRATHPQTTPPCSEQDPLAWWAALVRACREACADLPSDDRVEVIAVAGQQHGLVVTDRAATPLRPAKLWNDTESAPQASNLVDALTAEAWALATGSVPVAAFTVTKLAWLAQHEPAVVDDVVHLLLPHDWLNLRLTGRAVTDRGDASGTGYFDPTTSTWRPELLHRAAPGRSIDDWAAALPHVAGPRDTAGTLTAEAAAELGVDASTTVAAGTGDNMAGALGLGLVPGDVAISLGTSGTVYAVSDQPTVDATGAVAGFADASGRYLPLVCTLNATQVTDAMAAWLGVDAPELDRLALAARSGANGTVLVPYLSGERTPNRPDASGTITGLRTTSERGDLARAAFEGVVCGLLEGLDALGDAGVSTGDGRLFVLGGGSRSATYPRVIADLTARPVTLAEGDEHVATGACVQAAACLRDTDPYEIATEWGLGRGTEVEPDLTVDAASVRGSYARARDASAPR